MIVVPRLHYIEHRKYSFSNSPTDRRGCQRHLAVSYSNYTTQVQIPLPTLECGKLPCHRHNIWYLQLNFECELTLRLKFYIFSAIGGLILTTGMGDWYWLLEWWIDTDYWNGGLIMTTGMGDWYWLLEWGIGIDHWNGGLYRLLEWWIDTDNWNGGLILTTGIGNWY